MIALIALAAAVALKPVDGDTFWFGDEKIRVAAIDSPEPSKFGHAECLSEAMLGDLASVFTAHILETETIKLERKGIDVYGRTLARVQTDGGDLGERLIAAGLAKPYKGHAVDWCH